MGMSAHKEARTEARRRCRVTDVTDDNILAEVL
jgi:hypothetical protein